MEEYYEEETFVTKEQLEEIVKKYPTPFHLYDEKESVKMRRRSRKHFPGIPDFVSILR